MKRLILGACALLLSGAAFANSGDACYMRIYDPMFEFNEATSGQVVKSIMVGMRRLDATQTAVYIHADTISGPGARKLPCKTIDLNNVNSCAATLEYVNSERGPIEQSITMTFQKGGDVMLLKTKNLGVAHPIYPNDGMDNILIADRKNGVREMTTFKLYKTEAEACIYSD